MKYLVFDTETTGLFTESPDNYRNTTEFPRIVEIAWILMDDDVEVSSGEYIIKPVDFEIPTRASDIHGITTEKALLEGNDCRQVIDQFINDFKSCDRIVAHNIKYDKAVVAAELCRQGLNDVAAELFQKRYECTMMSTIKLCSIPQKNGKGIKFPKLQELHNVLFECKFENDHTALADVRATYKCLKELIQRGVIKNNHKEKESAHE